MIHERSLEAYRTIKENGLLKKLNWQVYDFLWHHGPRTTRDVTESLRIRDNGTTSGCITRLKEAGVVEEVGTKVCETTGMTVSLWSVTNRLPQALKREKKDPCPHCKATGYYTGHGSPNTNVRGFDPPKPWKETLFD